MTQTMDPETGQIIDSDGGDGSALAALNRSEIDMQISTAKKYPRSIAKAKRTMIEMATIDEATAKGCGYALKRTDKDGKIAWIEGPSIRMAEIAVSCWGNLRYGARIITEDDRFIVAQGVCHDLENNVYNAMEVRRRITTRNGKKYGDDMIGVTANAACAIAARNAVFKVVPMIIIKSAYAEAMKAAAGDEKTFSARRKNAVVAFQGMGVSTEDVCRVLGKADGAGLEDIDTTDLRRMHGLLTAIQDGDTTLEQVFGDRSPDRQALRDRIDGAGKQPPADAAKGAESDRTIEEKGAQTRLANEERKSTADLLAQERKAAEDRKLEADAAKASSDADSSQVNDAEPETFDQAAERIAREVKMDPEHFDRGMTLLRKLGSKIKKTGEFTDECKRKALIDVANFAGHWKRPEVSNG